MSIQNADKPDAFKAVMTAAQAEPGRAPLARQSLGRPLSDAETLFAAALMEIYSEGAIGSEAVAAGLTARAVAAPLGGTKIWTAESLEAELAAINADLDAAYQKNGLGA